MSEPFIGELKLVPYDYEPRNWSHANGRLIQIMENPTLFSLLGTQYGGDGRSSFALPNLPDVCPARETQNDNTRMLTAYDMYRRTDGAQPLQYNFPSDLMSAANTATVSGPYQGCTKWIIATEGVYPSRS